MKRILSWCRTMFTQKSGHIRIGKEKAEPLEIIASEPLVEVTMSTVFLNRKEASFINREVRRLLKNKMAEQERKKKKGVPSPPEPGKISYAVYK